MCSIAGADNVIEVKRMLSVQKHRAPDGNKVVYDGKYAIGMGRLAIVDVTSSDLFPYEEDNLKLTFNGEIYNYIELRKELRSKGYKFRTASDTEVLLKSYKEWGHRCLDHFNGMFAFSIYDGKKIFFARDFAGEKPFYYTEKPFRFASEAKSLGKCKELPRAHCGIYNFKTIRIWEYWKPKKIKIKNPVRELEALLSDSIKLRTRSDVPYALYLSDGIDSNLIKTFHKFKYTFTYKKGNKKDFLKNAKKIYYHLDYPVKSFSPYGLWKLAKKASKRVKVVLSGEGADELFGGYIRYIPQEIYRQAQKKFPSYKKMFPYNKDVNQQGWDDFNGNLQELLRMGDRMASAWGIENRCPFLDKRIIEFAFSLTPEQKINLFETKIPLRALIKKRMPKYKDVEKKGLFIPVNKWIGSKQIYDKDDYLKFQLSL